MATELTNIAGRMRRLVLGGARNPTEPGVYRKVSLLVLLAWIALGSNAISSISYGPQEAFRALGQHTGLAWLVAGAMVLTVLVITASYMQIVDLFPNGGGAYLVASKLLSPGMGMVAGSAMVLDYTLAITISVAAATNAVFSFLPGEWLGYRLAVAAAALAMLIVINLRGVREIIAPLIPIFALFLLTHGGAIIYALLVGPGPAGAAPGTTTAAEPAALGTGAALLVLLYAYSMSGATYTGIEAVSDNMGLLAEPRIRTGKRTMLYTGATLAILAAGLLLSYAAMGVQRADGMTLNASLFASLATGWGPLGVVFMLAALISQAVILLVAAQTGFMGGPTTLSVMAQDGWMPRQFALLSDRLITQNAILVMGVLSLGLLWLSGGNVNLLVVLYTISVFVTFTLAQLGMVRHWWIARSDTPGWMPRILVSGVGLAATTIILAGITILRWRDGGWVTLGLILVAVFVAVLIRRHYTRTAQLLTRLDTLFTSNLPVKSTGDAKRAPEEPPPSDTNTAAILVNGFNGLGLHTLFNVLRIFRGHFKNFVFIQVGVVDAGRFKGVDEIEDLKKSVQADVDRYVEYMRAHGYHADSRYSIGTDAVHQVTSLARQIVQSYPHSVIFTGQLVFPGDPIATRLLHNHMSFAIQKQLYHEGIPVLVLPVRL